MSDRIRLRSELEPRPWVDVAKSAFSFAVGVMIAFTLPAAMIIAIVLYAGCAFSSVGEYTPDDGTETFFMEPETVAADARCGRGIPCSTPLEAGGGSGGEDEVGSEDSFTDEGQGSSGSSSSSDEETSDGSSSDTGAPTSYSGLYGPCTDACTLQKIDFTLGCVCTVMCQTDEDCAHEEDLTEATEDGVCLPDFGWCAVPCRDGCSGDLCETAFEVDFCVWPEEVE